MEEYNLDLLWEEASSRGIQQIRSEWEWFTNFIRQEKRKLNILEFGAYSGGSTGYLHKYAKNMISIECVPRFDTTQFGDNYECAVGDSRDLSIMESYFKKFDWDLVLIDGDHTHYGVKTDFYNILPYLKPGTMVAFHDIVISDNHHRSNCYVGEFWEEMKLEYKPKRFEEIRTSDWAGIGVIWTH